MLTLPNRYGHPLVTIDRAVERRLRTKIDLFVVPTVSLFYLFCFIDRANIGEKLMRTTGIDVGQKADESQETQRLLDWRRTSASRAMITMSSSLSSTSRISSSRSRPTSCVSG